MEYLDRVAAIESSNNPNARAAGSSATGLYQMTKGTHAQLAQSKPWLGYSTWDQHAKDPKLQKAFASELTNQNKASLQKQGHAPDDLNTYLAHFAGAAGANKLLTADPNATVSQILGADVAKANPSLANKTVAELKGLFGKKLGAQSSSGKPWEQKWATAGMAEGGEVKPWEQKWGAAPVAPVTAGAPVAQAQAPVAAAPAPAKPAPVAKPARSADLGSTVSGEFDTGDNSGLVDNSTAEASGAEFGKLAKRTGAGAIMGGVVDPARAVAQFIPGLDKYAADAERIYEGKRKEWGGEGFDAARLAGSVVSPIGIKGASLISKAVPMTGKFGRGLVQGGAQGALGAGLQPLENVTEGTPVSELLGRKGAQVGLGAGLGGVLGGSIGKFGASTKAGEGNKAIEEISQTEGVRRYGEVLGKEAQEKLSPYHKMGLGNIEQWATSFPGTSAMATHSIEEAAKANQRAMINLALKPISGKIGATSSGRTAIGDAKELLTKEYDEILSKLSVGNKEQLASKIDAEMIPTLAKLKPAQVEEYNRLLKNELYDGFLTDPKTGLIGMDGKQWKQNWSTAKKQYDSYMTPTATPSDRQIGEALKQAWEISRKNLQGEKGLIERLKATDQAYYGYKILRKASEASSTAGGKFTPPQVINAIKQYGGQLPVDKQNELHQAAELSLKVFGPKYGDSGTAGRSAFGQLMTGGLGGAAFFDPTALAGGVALHGAYYAPYAAQAIGNKINKHISPAARGLIGSAGSAASKLAMPAGASRMAFSPNSRDMERQQRMAERKQRQQQLLLEQQQQVPAQAAGGYVGGPLASFSKGPLGLLNE